LADGCGDGVREIVGGGYNFVLVRVGNGTKSEDLQLNGEKADKADEEARKSRWVEDVTEEPLDVNVLRRRKAK